MRYHAPIEKCRACNGTEFDGSYRDGDSYAVCLGCLKEYKLFEPDDDDDC